MVDPRQLARMGSGFQFFGRIGNRRKIHPVGKTALKPVSPARTVGHLGPPDPGPVPGLLGNQICFHILRGCTAVYAQLRAPVPVTIVFFRSHPIPFHLIIIRVQREQETEFRHFRQSRYRVIVQDESNGAVRQEAVCHDRRRGRRCRQQIFHDDLRLPLLFFDLGPELRVMIRFRRVFRRCNGRKGVEAGQLPLTVSGCHGIACVIADRRAPEVHTGHLFDQFSAAGPPGSKTAPQHGEESVIRLTPDPDVEVTVDQLQPGGRRQNGTRRSGTARDRKDALVKGDFMPRAGPGSILPQPEADRQDIFPVCQGRQGRHGKLLFGKRSRCRFQAVFRQPASFFLQQEDAVQLLRICEQVLIPDPDPVLCYFSPDILVIVSDLLHLGVRPAGPVHNAVAAEVIIGRPLSAVAAVGLEFFAVAVLPPQGLIDKIPDEAALIAGLPVGKVRVFMHAAVGIAHGMGIFTADKRLFRVLPQERFYGSGGRIHLAFHVTGIRIRSVMEDAFIMDQAFRIQLPEALRHLMDHAAAKGFISAGPDQDGRMVLVPLITALDPVQQHVLPFNMVAGQDFRPVLKAALIQGPAAVGFHIVLGDHIDAVLIADPVQGASVGIMGGPDRVYIILFHGDHILQGLLSADGPAPVAGKLMAVDTFEDDPLPVQAHDPVLHFESAEAHFLQDHLLQAAVLASVLFVYLQPQVIQAGLFRAPEQGTGYLPADPHVLFRAFPVLTGTQFPIQYRTAFQGQGVPDPASAPVPLQLQIRGQGAVRVFIRSVLRFGNGRDLQIPYMDLRDRI